MTSINTTSASTITNSDFAIGQSAPQRRGHGRLSRWARARHFGRRLGRDEAGLSTVEYVVLLALIGAVSVGGWKTFGKDIKSSLDKSSKEFKSNVLSGRRR